jgi:hypothetical protein
MRIGVLSNSINIYIKKDRLLHPKRLVHLSSTIQLYEKNLQMPIKIPSKNLSVERRDMLLEGGWRRKEKIISRKAWKFIDSGKQLRISG